MPLVRGAPSPYSRRRKQWGGSFAAFSWSCCCAPDSRRLHVLCFNRHADRSRFDKRKQIDIIVCYPSAPVKYPVFDFDRFPDFPLQILLQLPPVIIYARECGVSEEMLFRALLVSNLVTIHLKTGIGTLSAYCGATSAGAGAGAGICYLYGGKYKEIAHTIVNALAINSGMLCDGAKASCAAKIASAVEAGMLGMRMYMHDSQFYGGDGIVVTGVENTIRAVSTIARDGMRSTDREVIRLMMANDKS